MRLFSTFVRRHRIGVRPIHSLALCNAALLRHFRWFSNHERKKSESRRKSLAKLPRCYPSSIRCIHCRLANCVSNSVHSSNNAGIRAWTPLLSQDFAILERYTFEPQWNISAQKSCGFLPNNSRFGSVLDSNSFLDAPWFIRSLTSHVVSSNLCCGRFFHSITGRASRRGEVLLCCFSFVDSLVRYISPSASKRHPIAARSFCCGYCCPHISVLYQVTFF